MNRFLLIALWLPLFLIGQDKLFYKDGKVYSGTLISRGSEHVFFRCSDSISTTRFPKKDVLLVETELGERYLFGKGPTVFSSNASDTGIFSKHQNLFGMQPLAFLLGRLTFVYERLSKDARFGVVVPLSLTFDPFGWMYPIPQDSGVDVRPHIPGIGGIIGLDINLYFPAKSEHRFFMGPRLRYGTDMMMWQTEGLSLQYQLGWNLTSSSSVSHHFSLGYGFLKILNLPKGSPYPADQLSPWFSINYRISLFR